MSEHITTGPVTVDWDSGIGILSITADDLAEYSHRTLVTFHSRIWISLDQHRDPTSVDILDVPEIVARVVPRASRKQDHELDTRGGAIPWLLDPDSDWLWIPLRDAPDRNRLVREGRVEVRFIGTLPLQLRLWVPVGGTANRAGRNPE